MSKLFVLAPAAVLLVATTVPDMPPPRYDVYSVEAGETIVTPVGKPFIVRTWIHSGQELWSLVPQDGVVALERAQFEQFPQPGEGAGFTEGYDLTIRIARPGTYRLKFQHTDKASGRIDAFNPDEIIAVTAR